MNVHSCCVKNHIQNIYIKKLIHVCIDQIKLQGKICGQSMEVTKTFQQMTFLNFVHAFRN